MHRAHRYENYQEVPMMYTLTIDDKPRSCRTSFKRDLNKKNYSICSRRGTHLQRTVSAYALSVQQRLIYKFHQKYLDLRLILERYMYQLISSHWSVADGRVFINCGGRSIGKERVVKQRELTFLHCLKCKIEKNICLIFE